MKNKFLTIACCLLFITVCAQNDAALKYASTITAQDLKKQLTIVASAEMEGRETATAGQRRAAAYIEGQFKQLGLLYPSVLKGYQQSYPLYKDTLAKSVLKIGKIKYVFGKDYVVMPGTDLKSEIKSKQLVFVGYGIDDKNYSDYTGKDVNGKVVVFFSGEPKINGKFLSAGLTRNEQWNTLKKIMVAKQKGAKAALLISTADTLSTITVNNARVTNMYLPRVVKKENERPGYATVVSHVGKDILGEQQYNELSKKATSAEPLNTSNIVLNSKTKFEYRKQQIPFSSSNVVGYIEGTDKKDEYVLLTAHYDHLGKRDTVIFYGADDDGSGTVSVIEMAEAFAKAKAEGHGPRRTIVFMTVSGEEKGLWGSEYYTDHPIFPLEKTTVDLNTDMVGRIDPDRKTGDSTNYVYVVGDDKLSTDLKIISTGINKKYINMELDYKYNDPADRQRIYFRSDHYNFAKKGVPIIFYYDGMLRPDYHRPTDTVDKINFNLMEKRVRFIFLTAWEMANMDNMLKRDIPLPAM